MKQLLLMPILLAALLLAAGTTAPSVRAASAALTCADLHRVRAPAPDPSVHEPVVGHMTIGVIGLSTPVFQAPNVQDVSSEASKSLNKGPAFYPKYMIWPTGLTNSQPGQGGTVAMLGHRTTRTHPFCLVDYIKPSKAYITLRVSYGTFKYLVVANKRIPGNSWVPFEHPGRYDPHPKRWAKGIKAEYLVFGACDPPGSAASRDVIVAKLVAQWG